MPTPRFGAGLWNFASYVDRYATDGYAEPVSTIGQIERAGAVGELSVVDLNYPFTKGVGVDEVKDALKANNLTAIGVTPEIYTRQFVRGAFTNPSAQVRSEAMDLLHESSNLVRDLEADYVKIWPGQDGWDYPFQVNHRQVWNFAKDGMRELASAHPDLRYVIEYKPREPRVKMLWDSAARTILGIQELGLDNVGVLLDFGHSLYGGESPADAAQMLIDHGLLWGMDVNDNLRAWDDDLMLGTVHLTELFEFFYTLRINKWEGVWQLDQFPFREDTVKTAKASIRMLKAINRALDELDYEALATAQDNQDAIEAQKIVQDVLLSSMRSE